MLFADLLPAVEDIAIAAGQCIMNYFQQPHDIARKNDGTVATKADFESEKIILERLQALTPNIPIVSEEAYAQGKQVDISGGEFWLVDPLDGTGEFLKGEKDFSVNIGLIRNQEPVLGVMSAPALNIIYSGAGLNSAARRDEKGRIPINVSEADNSFRVISSKSFGNEILLVKYLVGRTVSEHRYRSSALKFGDIAEGSADIYPRFGPSCEWDTAAGHAIVIAAGGSVTTADNQPLLYGKENFVNPNFVARGARK